MAIGVTYHVVQMNVIFAIAIGGDDGKGGGASFSSSNNKENIHIFMQPQNTKRCDRCNFGGGELFL